MQKPNLLNRLTDLESETTAHGSGAKSVFRTNEQMPHLSTQVAYGVFKPGEACEEHVHKTMYEYFFFITGEGTYTIDGEEYSLKPDTFLEIPAGIKHSLHADKNTELKFVYWGIAIK
ncbi:MAG: cupin domain-containing protein [Balneolaceae bacterium]